MPDWTSTSVERALREAARARNQIDAGTHEQVPGDGLEAVAATNHWLAMLDEVDVEIVRLRCSGARWKPICWQLGMGRATAHRRWKAALSQIAERLQHRRLA